MERLWRCNAMPLHPVRGACLYRNIALGSTPQQLPVLEEGFAILLFPELVHLAQNLALKNAHFIKNTLRFSSQMWTFLSGFSICHLLEFWEVYSPITLLLIQDCFCPQHWSNWNQETNKPRVFLTLMSLSLLVSQLSFTISALQMKTWIVEERNSLFTREGRTYISRGGFPCQGTHVPDLAFLCTQGHRLACVLCTDPAQLSQKSLPQELVSGSCQF